MTLILNNILFYSYSRPVFISLIIYIKKLSVKYYTLISSHAKSLKPGVQVQFFFFFRCILATFQMSHNLMWQGDARVAIQIQKERCGDIWKVDRAVSIGLNRIWALSLYFTRNFTRAFDFLVRDTSPVLFVNSSLKCA